jgi:hypothetical protein
MPREIREQVTLGLKKPRNIIEFWGAQQPLVEQGFLIHVFLGHTQWHITVGRNPLDGWSARHRDL